MRSIGKKAKKIVIKVGTATLLDDRFKLDIGKMNSLVEDVVRIKRQGTKVVLVSSGAVGMGVGRANKRSRPKEKHLIKAAASIGQSSLMYNYESLFRKHGQLVGQILLTPDEFRHRGKLNTLIATIRTMLYKLDAIPIINENDVVAFEENTFGNNDILSAYLTSALEADLLIMLSDVGGIYTTDPRKGNAELINEITSIKGMAACRLDPSTNGKGVGGVVTKLHAAKHLRSSNIPMIVVNGGQPNVLSRVLKGEELGTLFRWKSEP